MPDFTREELENWGSQFPLPVHPTRLEECANKLAVKSVHLAAFALRLMDDKKTLTKYSLQWRKERDAEKSARALDVGAMDRLVWECDTLCEDMDRETGGDDTTKGARKEIANARVRVDAWEKDNASPFQPYNEDAATHCHNCNQPMPEKDNG